MSAPQTTQATAGGAGGDADRTPARRQGAASAAFGQRTAGRPVGVPQYQWFYGCDLRTRVASAVLPARIPWWRNAGLHAQACNPRRIPGRGEASEKLARRIRLA